MALLQQGFVFHVRAVHLVVVVGDEHFYRLFVNQLPVVLVRRTVIHVGVIGSPQAVSRRNGRIIGQVGRTTDTTLAGVITPGLTRHFLLVKHFVNQYRTTGQTCRRLGEGQVVENDVVQAVEVVLGIVVTEVDFLLGSNQGVGTITLYRHFRSTTDHIQPAPAQDMVPDRLQRLVFVAATQDRERNPAKGIVNAGLCQ